MQTIEYYDGSYAQETSGYYVSDNGKRISIMFGDYESVVQFFPQAKALNRIVITKGCDAWYARTIGIKASEVMELFGCDTIPTAFTQNAKGEVVLEAIKKLNPLAEVVLRT